VTEVVVFVAKPVWIEVCDSSKFVGELGIVGVTATACVNTAPALASKAIEDKANREAANVDQWLHPTIVMNGSAI